ncbi:hypothetical protein D3C73_1345670 [compost metagenome]
MTLVPAATVPTVIPVAGSADGRATPATLTLPGTKLLPAGTGSDRTTLVTGAMPLLLMTEVYSRMSPTEASVNPALFTTATFGSATGMVSVFEAAVPAKVRPSGTRKVYAAVA